MNRILVIGSCGAGKSVLSRRLGDALALPVVHLDRLNWNPGWVDTPSQRLRDKVRDATRGERWVMDGNYSGTFDLRMPAADTIVFLDLSRWLCRWRVVKRVIQFNGTVRPDMSDGCPERFDWEFLEFVWDFHQYGRPKLLRALAKYAGPQSGKSVYHLRTPRDVEDFIQRVEPGPILDHRRVSGYPFPA